MMGDNSRGFPARATLFCGTILMVILQTAAWTQAQVSNSTPHTVVFICEHGAVKSVIAAAYFNKLAAERHLNFHAIARGITPQRELSTAAVAGLRKDGVAFLAEKPRALDRRDVRNAVRVVAFCPVPTSLAGERRLDSFDVLAPKDGRPRVTQFWRG
jgi:hypothetical protein